MSSHPGMLRFGYDPELLMNREAQTIFNGKTGDCFRTCVANVLELPLDDVPNFCAHEDWWIRLQAWLKPLNLFFCEIMNEGGKSPMPTLPPLSNGAMCIAAGIGPRGVRHAIVCRYRHSSENNKHWLELAHDPHPDSDGVEKVDTVGWFMVIDPAKPILKAAE